MCTLTLQRAISKGVTMVTALYPRHAQPICHALLISPPQHNTDAILHICQPFSLYTYIHFIQFNNKLFVLYEKTILPLETDFPAHCELQHFRTDS